MTSHRECSGSCCQHQQGLHLVAKNSRNLPRGSDTAASFRLPVWKPSQSFPTRQSEACCYECKAENLGRLGSDDFETPDSNPKQCQLRYGRTSVRLRTSYCRRMLIKKGRSPRSGYRTAKQEFNGLTSRLLMLPFFRPRPVSALLGWFFPSSKLEVP